MGVPAAPAPPSGSPGPYASGRTAKINNNRANLLALPVPVRRLHAVNRFATRARGVAWPAFVLLVAGLALGEASDIESFAALRAEATRLSMEGAHDAALDTLRRAARLAPADSPQLMADTVFILARADRCADAVTQFESLPPDYEKPLSLLLTVARCYRREREFEQASALYRVLMEHNSGNREAVRGMVLTLFDMGRQDEALALLDTVAQTAQPTPETTAASSPAAPEPQPQPAAPEPVAAAEPEPPSPDAMRAAAGEHLRAGRFADAVRGYEDVLTLRPDDTEAAVGLVSALIGAGETDRARELVRAFLEQHPDHVPLLFARAGLESNREDFDGALATYARILECDPDNAEARERAFPLLIRKAATLPPDADV
jgi:tetratricopeptide (TPR) repeat protein